jgi:nitrate reductase gamma subunit
VSQLYFFLEGVLPYVAIIIFVAGTLFRLWQWLKVPVPLRIGLAPARTTWKSVTGKIAAEVLFFVTLLRNDRTLWVAVWVMHVCGLIVLLGTHFLGLINAGLDLWTPLTISWAKTFLLVAASFSFPLGAMLLYLLYKRIAVPSVRRISIFGDYVALVLILFHVGNGIYMSFFTHLNMADVMRWSWGLVTFQPHIVPGSWIFALHCLSGFSLFIYFPFSKLFHPLGQITNRWTMTQKEEVLIEGGAVVK